MKAISWIRTAALAMLVLLPDMTAAAPLHDIPSTWIQPDGTVVDLLVSGDERIRHVTDTAGYTVVRDFGTGWLMYADVFDDRLIPTALAAGIDDPGAHGLVPGVRMPSSQAAEKTADRPALRSLRDFTPSTGTVNNLFVFIRFSDDDTLWEETASYDRQFNGVAEGEPSMRAYFREISLDAVDVVTVFTPPPDGKWMTAYTVPQMRRHYQPYDEVHNPGGYRNDEELEQREHALLKDALAYVEAYIPDGVDFDANDDGFFDNVIFMVQGWPDTWSDLLWPHKWEFWDEVTCKGLKVGTYNLQLSVLMLISPGTFVHEMYHSFGAPDLYHYSLDGIDAVGPWDVMDTTGLYAAQHPLSYMKWKYGNWIEDIPVVDQNEEVILSSNWLEGSQAVRVAVPESQSEYFVIEYRRAEGMFETSLPDSGVLVYRINPTLEGEGNRNGPPDEIWVFRPGGVPYGTGEISRAAMRAGRRTVMNEWTDPAPALGDGTPVVLRVYDVGEAGNNIALKICLNPPGCGARVCGDDGCGGWCGDCPAGNRCDGGACVPCSCVDRECGDDGCGVSCGECDDENPCTLDECVSNACVFTPDAGAACDDGDDCTSDDVCDEAGICSGAEYQCTPAECETASACDGNGGCVVLTYAEAGTPCEHLDSAEYPGYDFACWHSYCTGNGTCHHDMVPQGQTCDDGDPATENDKCDDQGHCNGHAIVTSDILIGDPGDPDGIAGDAEQPEVVEETGSKGGCSQGSGQPALPVATAVIVMLAVISMARRRFHA